MDIINKHKEASIVIAGLIIVFGVIGVLGYKSIMNREALVNSAVRRSTADYSGATIVTNYGSIEIEFLSAKSPKTVRNFIKLSESNFFNDIKFHRVIRDFMIQGGDPNSKGDDTSLYGRGGPGYKFDDEISDEPLTRGIVAMANSGANTNGSQFFIITAPSTPWLQGLHTAFAKVVEGMDVVDKINKVATGMNDIPLESIIIERVNLK